MDFSSEENEILINPRFPPGEKEKLAVLAAELPLKSHFLIATSGSTAESFAQYKWTALSKKAILASAESVNRHLKSDRSDIWFHSLPTFHVGGLGIIARAFLSQAEVSNYEGEKWAPEAFYDQLSCSKATLTSLVPAQVYDLVHLKMRSPKNLRAVVVGGGPIGESLYQKARALGWPLLPSYGMTECASQIATAPLVDPLPYILPRLKVLEHIQIKITTDGTIAVKSPSLLTLYAFFKDGNPCYKDPKQGEWLLTEDRGKLLSESELEVYGRESSFIKIGGESVDMNRLEKILEDIKIDLSLPFDAALVSLPDERLGSIICLAAAHASEQEAASLAAQFKTRVLPFEQIRRVCRVPQIPRTALQKLAKNELIKLIQNED